MVSKERWLLWCNRDEVRDNLEEANRSKDKWQEECHSKEDDHGIIGRVLDAAVLDM